MTGIDDSMRQLIDHVVGVVPGVVGAVVSSADGFVLASRLPDDERVDTSAVAAMSAAALGLADRLVRLVGERPATVSHHRSDDGQVFVFTIVGVAVLTVLADARALPEQIRQVGRELTIGLERLLRPAPQA